MLYNKTKEQLSRKDEQYTQCVKVHLNSYIYFLVFLPLETVLSYWGKIHSLTLYCREVEAKQNTELAMRNMQMELRTALANIKQVPKTEQNKNKNKKKTCTDV